MPLRSAAFQAVPTPLLIVGPDDRVAAANGAVGRTFGVGVDLEGRPVRDLPGPLAELGPLVAEAREGGGSVSGDVGGRAHAQAQPFENGAVLVSFAVEEEAAADLRASEVLASISDAFFALDRDWVFSYINEQAEPLLDRKREALLGKCVWDEFPEAVGSPFWDAYHRAAETGEVVHFDAFYEPLGRHFAVRAYPFRGGVSVYFADVTAQKRAEAALRERTRALEAVVRVNALLAAELDPDRLVQGVVDAGRELTGAAYAAFFYTPVEGRVGDRAGMLYALSGAPREAFDSLPTLQLTPLFHPTFAESATVRSDDVLADPRYGLQAPHAGMPEGHLPVRSYLAVPVRDADGGALGALLFGHPEPAVFDAETERAAHGVAHQAAIALTNARLYADLRAELAERERAEQALRQSERQFRQMAESLPQLVWTTTPDGYHDYFNDTWYAFTGMPRPDEPGGENAGGTQGFRWADYLHPDDLDRTAERWAHSLRTGEPYEVEYRFRRAADGAYRWFIGRAAPLRDAAGEIVRWFGTSTDIHDQKRTAEALRESDARARLALDAARLGLWTLDPATGAGTQDPRTLDILGLDGQVGLAEALERAVHPDDRERVAVAIGAALDPSGDGRLATELRVRRPDGEERWVYVTAQASFEGAGADRRAVQMVGTMEDVTADRDAAEALRENEERFRAVSEITSDFAYGICVKPDGALATEWVMGAYEDILGVPAPEPDAPADTWSALVHPDDLPAAQERFGRLMRAEPIEGEYRVLRPDGEVRWLRDTVRPVLDEEGALVEVVGAARDVTAEKEGELALRSTQTRLQLALEGGGMGTWEWDTATDAISYDDQAARLWGVEPGAFETAAAFLNIVHPDDLPALQRDLAAAVESGDRYASEFRILLPSGQARWLAARGRVLRGADGSARFLGLNFDVTERREAEDALRRKNAEMEQFAYTISHDLKSPLVTITGFLGVLKGHLRAGRPEKAAAAADRVLGAAERMGRLIEDLLHLSRAGRVVGDPARVDLDDLVGGLADSLARRVEEAGGQLEVEGPLGRVLADERRLGEVVENLLANAVTYGLGGGGTRIRVRSEQGRGGGLCLIVEDDGPGVPAEYREKVFGLFQRLDAGSAGTGIGLALVARVMEVMGGRAYVEGAGGPDGREGARFVLDFPPSAVPRKRAASRPPSGPAEPAPAEPAPADPPHATP